MESRPLLLFDDLCNLCQGTVRRVRARDRQGRFEYASLQSERGQEVLREAWPGGAVPDSLVVVDERGVHARSGAVLAIVRALGWPWSLLGVLWLVPRPLRDALYRAIATRRYAWFGQPLD